MPRRRNSRDPQSATRIERRMLRMPTAPRSKWTALADQWRSRDRHLTQTGVDLRIVDALGLNQRYILSARCVSCSGRIASLFAVSEDSLGDLKQLLEYSFWVSGPDSTCTCTGHLPEPAELVDDIVRALAPERFGASEWREPEAYFVRLTPDMGDMNT